MTFDLSNLNVEQIEALIGALQQHKTVVENEETFSQEVEKVKEERITKRLNEIEFNLKVYETVNAAFEVALTQTINDKETAKWIVSKLDYCRQIDDFRHFSVVYRKYAKTDLKFEEMLKCLAAIYRLKVKKYYQHSSKYSDRAIVRKELRCPYCGEMAQKLVKFLAVRGIKWED